MNDASEVEVPDGPDGADVCTDGESIADHLRHLPPKDWSSPWQRKARAEARAKARAAGHKREARQGGGR